MKMANSLLTLVVLLLLALILTPQGLAAESESDSFYKPPRKYKPPIHKPRPPIYEPKPKPKPYHKPPYGKHPPVEENGHF